MNVVYVIPAYNEASAIKSVIDSCSKAGHVVVVNDGSIDHTAEVVRATQAHLINHNTNIGYAAALKSGLSFVLDKYETICVIDADGEIPPDIFKKYLDTPLNNSFIIGDRQTKNRFVESFICKFLRLNSKINDPLCGGFVISGTLNKATLNKISHAEMDNCFLTYKFTACQLAQKVLNIHFKPKKRNGKSRFGSGLALQLDILRSYIKAAYYAANN
jgi:glycosyltransferase involved in cell wall biosynthesis